MTQDKAFGAKPRPFQEGPLEILNMHKFDISNVAADADIVPSNTYPIKDAYDTDWLRVKAVKLLIVGTAKNTFAGDNKLNGAQNIQVNINGGAYTTVATLVDDSLPCSQGGTHNIAISVDIKALMTALTNNIGVKWASAAADSDGMTITVTTLADIFWEV